MAELGSDLEDYDLGLRLPEEFLDVVDDDIDIVAEEDAVADPAVLLDPDIEDPGTRFELVVD